MNIISIIPARMGSSRFPDKPLKKINGIPMIAHVYYRVKMCKSLNGTFIATCDKEILEYIEGLGGEAIMTSEKHERASDRVAEAMKKIEEKYKTKIDIVVMVQGDEPMVTPSMIESSLEPFKQSKNTNIVNLVSRIKSVSEFEDPNEIKVVFNDRKEAIYFSREPIPSKQKFSGEIQMYKQVCVIPFTKKYLLKFNNLPEGKLEKIESIDMLRVVESGGTVHLVEINENSFSVDTEEDLIKVEKAMKFDRLLPLYKGGHSS